MLNTYTPNTVNELAPAEDEILWRQVAGKRWQTERDLRHISNPACGDLRNRTQSLAFVNFAITSTPETITGLELRILSQRNGRIADDQIQLVYQGVAIGNNNFNYYTDRDGNLTVENDATYGGPEDLWGAEITPEMIQDPEFGVILKFQSHPYYPHSSSMLINSVLLTIY
jgi:hypothetical protein